MENENYKIIKKNETEIDKYLERLNQRILHIERALDEINKLLEEK